LKVGSFVRWSERGSRAQRWGRKRSLTERAAAAAAHRTLPPSSLLPSSLCSSSSSSSSSCCSCCSCCCCSPGSACSRCLFATTRLARRRRRRRRRRPASRLLLPLLKPLARVRAQQELVRRFKLGELRRADLGADLALAVRGAHQANALVVADGRLRFGRALVLAAGVACRRRRARRAVWPPPQRAALHGHPDRPCSLVALIQLVQLAEEAVQVAADRENARCGAGLRRARAR